MLDVKDNIGKQASKYILYFKPQAKPELVSNQKHNLFRFLGF